MSKPREFWLSLYVRGSGVVHFTKTHADISATGDELLHVIEKSAYDALAAELEFSKSETAERESMNRLHLKTMKQLENDIDQLRTANAELVEALEEMEKK